MKNVKKFLSLGLAAAMAVSVAACGGKTSATNDVIDIGSWWVQDYDSDDDIYTSENWLNNQDKEGDDEVTLDIKAFNRECLEMKWENVSKIEETYGVKFYWQNLTIGGVKESINTSILAGKPDCDIYLVDVSMALPAQMNGLALDLRTVLPEDADVFNEQKIVSYVDLGDGKVCILKRVEAAEDVSATYPLGFNVTLLEDAGLEDPRDLWDRGEWTWDKFIEYCNALTKDTDGDGQTDQYGFCGFTEETLTELMMSNGTGIAIGATEGLSSAATGEALKMLYDMYNTYTFCYPYDFDGEAWVTNRFQYKNGNIGFFPVSAWFHNDHGNDYKNEDPSANLPFDIAYVRWPVGPSGNKDTNAGKNASNGEFYIIPVGVLEPEKVYNVLVAYWNWFDGDTSIRDDRRVNDWWYNITSNNPELQVSNFNVMADAGSRTSLDLWTSLGVEYDLTTLVDGTTTPSQWQETYRQLFQDALDAYFK